MKTKNIFITGIPRSGTTLVTATIHQVPNCVAISEPPDLKPVLKNSATTDEYADGVNRYIQQLREKIRNGEPVLNSFDRETGRLNTNRFRRVHSAAGHMAMEKTFEVRECVMPVESEDFLLAVKNNAQFTAALASLVKLEDVQIIAVIRHPIACLLSWRSLEIPVSRGRLPAGEHFSKQLRRLKKADDLLYRQVCILDWFLEMFYRHRERITIIAYERFVEKPEMLRQVIDVPDDYSFPQYRSMNQRKEYNFEEAELIRAYLKKYSRFVRFFCDEFADDTVLNFRKRK
ncbi:MAG: sulfotransferase [candidate division KSB1 bacterium]|nr:sulfotransferase [candidate division KSB1 bacterium]